MLERPKSQTLWVYLLIRNSRVIDMASNNHKSGYIRKHSGHAWVKVLFALSIITIASVTLFLNYWTQPEFGDTQHEPVQQLTVLDQEESTIDNKSESSSKDADDLHFTRLVNRAIQYYRENKLMLALNTFDKAEAILQSSEPHYINTTLVNYYTTKAELHWSLWQVAEAQRAWIEALNYLNDRKKVDSVKRQLAQATDALHRLNRERGEDSIYVASPNRGPAGVLVGHIAVVFFYMEDWSVNSWGPKQRYLSDIAFSNVKQWYSNKAAEYHKTVSFTVRKFTISRDPFLKRTKPHFNQPTSKLRILLKRVIRNIGGKDISQFIAKIKTQEKADHVAISFLVNREDRSFAIRCLTHCSDSREYVFLLEKVKSKRINDIEYALAHELLHLFGADDLYNIANATYYATRDIMHYQSKFLNAMSLEPLTAYSVGLIDTPPATPFTVKSY